MLQEVKVGFVHVAFKPIEGSRFVKHLPQSNCYSEVLHIDRCSFYFQGVGRKLMSKVNQNVAQVIYQRCAGALFLPGHT